MSLAEAMAGIRVVISEELVLLGSWELELELKLKLGAWDNAETCSNDDAITITSHASLTTP
jgi:hypothetical protein